MDTETIMRLHPQPGDLLIVTVPEETIAQGVAPSASVTQLIKDLRVNFLIVVEGTKVEHLTRVEWERLKELA